MTIGLLLLALRCLVSPLAVGSVSSCESHLGVLLLPLLCRCRAAAGTFTLTDKEFPVFIEDIRLSKFQMDRIQTRSSQRAIHARGIERFQLLSLTKASIIGSMPMTLDKETKSHVRATYHTSFSPSFSSLILFVFSC